MFTDYNTTGEFVDAHRDILSIDLQFELDGHSNHRAPRRIPTNAHAAISSLFEFIEYHPGEAAATEPIQAGATNGSAEAHFVAIANSTVPNADKLAVDSALSHDSGHPAPDDCSHAELYFGMSRDILDPSIDQDELTERGYQQDLAFFVDDSMRPIIMKKYKDEHSGLTLEPISIDGIYVPPGTIVGTRTHDLSDRTDNNGFIVPASSLPDSIVNEHDLRNNHRMRIIRVDAISSVVFGRLSMWSHTTQHDREAFNGSSTSEQRLALSRTTLQSFRDIGTHSINEALKLSVTV